MGQEYYTAQYLTDAQPFQPDLGLAEQGWLASADPAQASSPSEPLTEKCAITSAVDCF